MIPGERMCLGSTDAPFDALFRETTGVEEYGLLCELILTSSGTSSTSMRRRVLQRTGGVGRGCEMIATDDTDRALFAPGTPRRQAADAHAAS